MSKNKIIFFILTLICAFFALKASVNVQPSLATGDHGRDFYCFEQILKGYLPYKDFYWVYGPLMPYYYAIFYKFLGVNMLSIRIGYYILILISTALVYLSLSTLTSPLLAFIGAIWYLNFRPDFFYTYNHDGGIVLGLFVLFCLFLYLKKPLMRFLYWALIAVFLLCLIKINFGIILLCVSAASVFLIDRSNAVPFNTQKKNLCLLAFVLMPAVTAIIYWLLVKDLPLYAIGQCLPYFSNSQLYNTTLLKSSFSLIQNIFETTKLSWINLSLSILIILSAIQSFLLIIKRSREIKTGKIFLQAFIILLLFYFGFLHEYLKGGLFYRTFWATPFAVLLIFTLIYYATSQFSQFIKFLLYSSLLFFIFNETLNNIMISRSIQRSAYRFSHDRVKIYLGSSPKHLNTIGQTVNFLNTNLKPGELFFALPYDPLYYFLTNKKSPTWEMIFFDHINIPTEQERSIIAELEQAHVNWILISSRANSKEPGMGIFGKTYCPVLGEYVKDHFEKVAQFGDWANPAGWAWNHGTMILKRRVPL